MVTRRPPAGCEPLLIIISGLKEKKKKRKKENKKENEEDYKPNASIRRLVFP